MMNLDVVAVGESMVQLIPTRTDLLCYTVLSGHIVAGGELNAAFCLDQRGRQARWISRRGSTGFEVIPQWTNVHSHLREGGFVGGGDQ